jgi:predicted GTPase
LSRKHKTSSQKQVPEKTGQTEIQEQFFKKMTNVRINQIAKPKMRHSKTGKSGNQNPIHITIVGAPKVGKSALAVRLLTNRFIG